LAFELVQNKLAGIPLFKELGIEQLDIIQKNSREISLKKGQHLFYKGDACNGFYIVIDGWITISFLSTEGKEHVLRIVAPGQSLGEAIMFLDKPYPANARANTDSHVIYIRKNVIFQCLEDDPIFVKKMISGLSQRLHALTMEVESITLQSSKQRVIGYLLQNQQKHGTEAEQGTADVTLSVNKATIAAHLHLTPETLSRTLHCLADQGLINVEGKVIHITDIDKLSQHALLDITKY
jgi:CRP-like cAMP-binding protein